MGSSSSPSTRPTATLKMGSQLVLVGVCHIPLISFFVQSVFSTALRNTSMVDVKSFLFVSHQFSLIVRRKVDIVSTAHCSQLLIYAHKVQQSQNT